MRISTHSSKLYAFFAPPLHDFAVVTHCSADSFDICLCTRSTCNALCLFVMRGRWPSVDPGVVCSLALLFRWRRIHVLSKPSAAFIFGTGSAEGVSFSRASPFIQHE